MYIYLNAYTYIHTYIHTHVHTQIHAYTLIYTYIHTYTRTYLYTCIHTHIYIHTYIHTYMHIYVHEYGYHNFTTMLTGHGNTRSYFHRFKIIETPTHPCGTKDQTTQHLLFECELLNKERDSLTSTILKTDVWPVSKLN